MEKYLRPTSTIDCDTKSIREKAEDLTKGQEEVTDKAKSLFYFVRDEVKYSPFMLSDKPEDFRASATLNREKGFCIQKAVLLAALARDVGIPARLLFAAIRNHLLSGKIKELMRGNLFPSHGYDELYIEGKWVKAAPTFNLKMCQENRLVPVEFDGRHNAILPAHNLDGRPHIEYVEDRGCYDDLPLDKIIAWRIQDLGADFPDRLRQAVEAREAKG
jgi:transglutaminase-like putative cysteine protease